MPYGTPSEAYTNSAPDRHSLYPNGQHILAFYIKCVPPVGQAQWLLCLTAKGLWCKTIQARGKQYLPLCRLSQNLVTYHHEVASIPLGEVSRGSCWSVSS